MYIQQTVAYTHDNTGQALLDIPRPTAGQQMKYRQSLASRRRRRMSIAVAYIIVWKQYCATVN